MGRLCPRPRGAENGPGVDRMPRQRSGLPRPSAGLPRQRSAGQRVGLERVRPLGNRLRSRPDLQVLRKSEGQRLAETYIARYRMKYDDVGGGNHEFGKGELAQGFHSARSCRQLEIDARRSHEEDTEPRREYSQTRREYSEIWREFSAIRGEFAEGRREDSETPAQRNKSHVCQLPSRSSVGPRGRRVDHLSRGVGPVVQGAKCLFVGQAVARVNARDL